MLFNAGWNKTGSQWEYSVLKLRRRNRLIAILLIETERFDSVIQFQFAEFNWIHDETEVLYVNALAYFYQLLKTSKKANELTYAKRHQTLSSQLIYIRSLHEISLRFMSATSIHSLCRVAVELGRLRLHIDRMAIFLCDLSRAEMWGTWGTNEHGELIDRSDFREVIPASMFMQEAFTKKTN